MSTLNEARSLDSGESIAMLLAGTDRGPIVVTHTYEREWLLDLLSCDLPRLLRGGAVHYKVRTSKGFRAVFLLPKNKY